jgi:hypothetical protein
MLLLLPAGGLAAGAREDPAASFNVSPNRLSCHPRTQESELISPIKNLAFHVDRH